MRLNENIYNRPGADIPPFLGPNIFDIIGSRLLLNLNSKYGWSLGFNSLDGKVLDVGTRDGRYVEWIRYLGADEVYGLEPEKSELDKAVESKKLNKKRAINSKLEEIGEKFNNFFDYAVIFNWPLMLNNEAAVERLEKVLKTEGGILATFASEQEVYLTEEFIKDKFDYKIGFLFSTFPHNCALFGVKNK